MTKISWYHQFLSVMLWLIASFALLAWGCGVNEDLFGSSGSGQATGMSGTMSGGGGQTPSSTMSGAGAAAGAPSNCLDDCAFCGAGQCCEQTCTDACDCSDGCDCSLSCPNPPCDITCYDEGTSCAVDCSGDSFCLCKTSAEHCDFSCDQAPCDVLCEGGSNCSAVCRNGGCECKGQANCDFDCQGDACGVLCRQSDTECRVNCHSQDCVVECRGDAACILDCSDAPPNADCAITNCGGGLQDCPDKVIACRTACPP